MAFDFRIGDQRFRARRTLSREGRPTRQLYQSSGTASAESWDPIPDTNSEQGFRRWVESKLALSYETFTASVLLLQGRADNVLEAGPAERHDLLSQVVGLAPYEQLFQQAKSHLARARMARSLNCAHS